MTKALLFDLDGTLLPVDTDRFVEHYVKALIPYVTDYFKPEEFVKILWDSTNEMIKNQDAGLTNEEVFTKHFIEKTGINKSDIWPIFDRFYEEHFPKLKVHTEPNEMAYKIVETAKEQGRKIIIATNPVFPRAAIHERLNWLGLLDFPFELVTVYEESHFCKPQPLFFKEALDRANLSPDNAIMIGNDMQEDMVASQIGMDTYLVTDYLVDRGKPTYKVTQTGTLDDLMQQLKAKKNVFAF